MKTVVSKERLIGMKLHDYNYDSSYLNVFFLDFVAFSDGVFSIVATLLILDITLVSIPRSLVYVSFGYVLCI